jgi:hypothetical protein
MIKLNRYAITGAYHGSIVFAPRLAEAKKAFRKAWNREKIIRATVRHKNKTIILIDYRK